MGLLICLKNTRALTLAETWTYEEGAVHTQIGLKCSLKNINLEHSVKFIPLSAREG